MPKNAFAQLLPEAHAAVDALEANFSPTWKGLVESLRDACRPLYDAWGLLGHMLSVMNNAEWRRVQEALQPKVVAFSLRVGQSRRFYEGFRALAATDEHVPSLTPIRRRILSKTILGAEQAGVGLPPDKPARFNAIQQELALIGTAFRNNELDATKAFAPHPSFARGIDGFRPRCSPSPAQAAREQETPPTLA
jgi:oligopeptidase A